MTTHEKKYYRMFCTGRLSRGRTIIDLDYHESVHLDRTISKPHWAECIAESDLFTMVSKLNVQFQMPKDKADDIPWCIDYMFVSARIREVLEPFNSQVVWAPVTAKNTGKIGPSELTYYAMLPRHVVACAKRLAENAKYDDLPAEYKDKFLGRFILDLAAVPAGFDIFTSKERPGRAIVSERVRTCIEQARAKRAYFSSPDDLVPLW